MKPLERRTLGVVAAAQDELEAAVTTDRSVKAMPRLADDRDRGAIVGLGEARAAEAVVRRRTEEAARSEGAAGRVVEPELGVLHVHCAGFGLLDFTKLLFRIDEQLVSDGRWGKLGAAAVRGGQAASEAGGEEEAFRASVSAVRGAAGVGGLPSGRPHGLYASDRNGDARVG